MVTDSTKTLVFDLDGVLVDYNFPALIWKWFHCKLSSQRLIKDYSLEDVLGVTPTEIAKMFAVECFAKPNVSRKGIKLVKELLGLGYEVHIWSNRLMYMTKEELEDWLTKYDIPFTSVLTNDTLPSYVYTAVDDKPSKLMALDATTTVKQLVLFNRPWNEYCINVTGKLFRVWSYKQLQEVIINGISGTSAIPIID